MGFEVVGPLAAYIVADKPQQIAAPDDTDILMRRCRGDNRNAVASAILEQAPSLTHRFTLTSKSEKQASQRGVQECTSLVCMVARRASEGHKGNHSTSLRHAVVSLVYASGY